MHETAAGMHTDAIRHERRRAARPLPRRHNPASSLCAAGKPLSTRRAQSDTPPMGGGACLGLLTSGPRGGLTRPPRGLPAFTRKTFVAGGRAVAPAGRWNASARSVLRDSRYPIHRALLKSSGTRLPRTRSTENTENTERLLFLHGKRRPGRRIAGTMPPGRRAGGRRKSNRRGRREGGRTKTEG